MSSGPFGSGTRPGLNPGIRPGGRARLGGIPGGSAGVCGRFWTIGWIASVGDWAWAWAGAAANAAAVAAAAAASAVVRLSMVTSVWSGYLLARFAYPGVNAPTLARGDHR